MNHAVKAYLKRLSTKELLAFVRKYANRQFKEDYTFIIPDVLDELLNRIEPYLDEEN